MAGPLLRSLFSSARKSVSSSSFYRCNHCQSSPFFPRATGITRAFSSAPATAAAAPSSSLDPSRLRNVAVIAHVDHGKTTLMDRLLRQCGADIPHERAMDSISLERERGITIASKVTSISWKENELNMVDTPGHADFGGEVERVVGMVEGAILVVDAGEGPLAQTKFVLVKALKYGLRPILLLNKVDRPAVSEERCNEVESLVFDLFANLGATEEQLDFPVLYASAKEGWASSTFTKDPPANSKNMSQLLDAIITHVPPPKASLDAPFQMLVSMMEKDFYLGRILTGRVASGVIHVGDRVHGLRSAESGVVKIEEGKVLKLMKKKGTNMVLIDSAGAGDIVSMAGMTSPSIGHTIANVEVMNALPTVELDPPTISMTFGVNDSPLAGRDGSHLTGGKIGDRLMAEAETNLAINVIPGLSESYEVQGRGELQLGILIENMRREGFELSVSPPKVMYKTVKGEKLEPIEEVIIEINEEHVGLIMEALSHRRAEVVDMGPVPGNIGRTRLSLTCPSRGLVGYRSVFSSDTRGTGFMHRAFLSINGLWYNHSTCINEFRSSWNTICYPWNGGYFLTAPINL
ncbi:50S ribosomal subunit assembly factor BipA isoform X3 [Manihot esculenta]|uniref:50S ribosomal subunit assembly factor BipA isoform X3 n=1 Tax=Manihot esculenta TaxID=3983 RepID=UPI001CC58181|nr:50S ribosomal subunit assembly factor BipA isoform X3 [Manihot esculenta]